MERTAKLLNNQTISFEDPTTCPSDHSSIAEFIGNGLNGKNDLGIAFWTGETFDCRATDGFIHRISAIAEANVSPAMVRRIQMTVIPASEAGPQ